MKYEDLSNSQQQYVNAICVYTSKEGIDIDENTEYSRALLRLVSMDHKGKIWIPNWITHDLSRRAGRGLFRIPEVFDLLSSEADEGTVEEENKEMIAV